MFVARGADHDQVGVFLLSELDKRLRGVPAAHGRDQGEARGSGLLDGVGLHLSIVVEAFGLLRVAMRRDRPLSHRKRYQTCPVETGQLQGSLKGLPPQRRTIQTNENALKHGPPLLSGVTAPAVRSQSLSLRHCGVTRRTGVLHRPS